MVDAPPLVAALRAAARREASPDEAARETAATVPDGELRQALVDTLTVLARHAVQTTRAGAARAHGEAPPSVPAVVPSTAPPVAAPPAVVSPKRDAIAGWWSAALRADIDLGEGRTMRLGDMAHTDLLAAATAHAEAARAVMDRARGLRRLADVLAHHGVRTVADLPRGTLQAALPAVVPQRLERPERPERPAGP